MLVHEPGSGQSLDELPTYLVGGGKLDTRRNTGLWSDQRMVLIYPMVNMVLLQHSAVDIRVDKAMLEVGH